jgi:hypothetical protein
MNPQQQEALQTVSNACHLAQGDNRHDVCASASMQGSNTKVLGTTVETGSTPSHPSGHSMPAAPIRADIEHCEHRYAAYVLTSPSLTSQPSAVSPLQLAKPARHVRGEQVPPEQVAGSALAPEVQVVLQLPQLVAAVFRFTCTSAAKKAADQPCGQQR